MRYRYRAVDRQGRIECGHLDADNLPDLELRLARIGLALIRARMAAAPLLSLRRAKRRELVAFCFHLEQLTHAGVPLIEGLTDLRDSLDDPHFRRVVASLVEEVESGQTLSQALAAHPDVFDAVFVGLVRAGEASGELPEILKRLGEALKWQDELAAQTWKALTYPAFAGLLVFGVLGFLMTYLVPKLAEFIATLGQTLPLGTRLLIAASAFFATYWWLILGLPVAIFVLVRFRAAVNPAFRQRLDGWKIRLPLIGPLLHKIVLARLAGFFALLYAAGIPVLECLRLLEGIVGNAAMAAALSRLGAQIGAGQSVSESFAQTRLFPPLVLRMLRVGEQTGRLDTALLNVSYFYDRDVKESAERLQRLIEPALTVILGLLLAWIMSAVLGPIFDTIGRIK
ncbi:type IV pilus assembly protein PilC [Formivibrio citricus]|uniref:Type IV pilus assembly protein PilC n=1 Tax=Formivibrio citricus TaxID=83765 RepID=A0A1I5DD31_9NEIS|nr:type II secretion system F family protein [Formivibrio citricus]SFN97145.1 type IV pilus assembly protein PilC [Formivibrio citricus]